MNAIIKEHVEKKTIMTLVVTPAHGSRDTAHFRKSVNRLKKDDYYRCFVSNKVDELQVHHIAEFSLENIVDFDKLKRFLICFDPYGYSHSDEFRDVPITSVDDVRNLIVLNREYHNNVNEKEGNGTGIHNETFPLWVAQCVCKNGEDPVPEEGESLDQVRNRVD